MTALCDITKRNMQEYFVVVYNLNFLYQHIPSKFMAELIMQL